MDEGVPIILDWLQVLGRCCLLQCAWALVNCCGMESSGPRSEMGKEEDGMDSLEGHDTFQLKYVHFTMLDGSNARHSKIVARVQSKILRQMDSICSEPKINPRVLRKQLPSQENLLLTWITYHRVYIRRSGNKQ